MNVFVVCVAELWAVVHGITCVQVRLKLETIRADVDEFGGKAYRMGKANKDDAVVALLKDQLDEFKQVCWLPVTKTSLESHATDKKYVQLPFLLFAGLQLHGTPLRQDLPILLTLCAMVETTLVC